MAASITTPRLRRVCWQHGTYVLSDPSRCQFLFMCVKKYQSHKTSVNGAGPAPRRTWDRTTEGRQSPIAHASLQWHSPQSTTCTFGPPGKRPRCALGGDLLAPKDRPARQRSGLAATRDWLRKVTGDLATLIGAGD